ncbi:hypothetical protein Droror1_Dr00020105 [Drosera rotundifolia]
MRFQPPPSLSGTVAAAVYGRHPVLMPLKGNRSTGGGRRHWGSGIGDLRSNRDLYRWRRAIRALVRKDWELKMNDRIKDEIYKLQKIYAQYKKVLWVPDPVELQLKAKWATEEWKTKAQRTM